MTAQTDTSGTATGLVLGTASFGTNPPTTQNVTITHLDGSFQGNHWILSANQSVSIAFDLDESTFTKTPTIAVRGLVSRNGAQAGHAPISLTVNGNSVVRGLVVSPEGYSAETVTIQIPPAFLDVGANTLTLTADSGQQTYFWLYDLAVDLTSGPYTGHPMKANLRVSPVALDPGIAIVTNTGTYANGHWKYAGGQSFALSFVLSDVNARNDDIRVLVEALVSRDGDEDGYAPITVSVNGHALITHYTMPGGGYVASTAELVVPAEMCVSGANTVTVTVDNGSRTYFWLFGLTVVPAEYWQALGTADFNGSSAVASGLQIVRAQGSVGGGRLTMGTSAIVEVSFDVPLQSLVLVEFDALVSRLGDQDGYAPVTVSANGAALVSGFTVPGGGYTYVESAFVVPPQILAIGANTITLQVASGATSNFWLKALRVRALLNGPAVRRETATAGPSYTSYGAITAVPLLFLTARASSALGIVDGIDEIAGSETIDTAISVLDAAAVDLTWARNAIDAALASGSVTLAGITIQAGSSDATALQGFLGYAIDRCGQESRRLGCVKAGQPLDFLYTYGCDVSAEITARLAQVSPVSQQGGLWVFTDSATQTTYSYPDSATATAKRSQYETFLQAQIVSSALEVVQSYAETLANIEVAAPQDGRARALFVVTALLVAAVAVAVFNIYYGYRATQQSTNAQNGGNYPMNWKGWIDDWSAMISYDWKNIVGVGYLLPGNQRNVCTGPGTREVLPLDNASADFGSYYNYVYIASDEYPIRLSPKDPRLSPPGETYHSQLAGGMNVDCAGEMQFAGGKFRYVNTLSGHFYKEADWDTCRTDFIAALAAMGYDTSEITDRFYTGVDLDLLG